MVNPMPENDKERYCIFLTARQSLLLWGYSKLIISAILLSCFSNGMIETIWWIQRYWSRAYIPHVVTFCGLPSLFAIDIVFHLIFIIGIYKELDRLLKVYYMFTQIWLVLTTILTVYVFIMMNESLGNIGDYGNPQQTKLLLITLTTMFICLVIQTLIIMLLKNEIAKMEYFRLIKDAMKDGLIVNFEKVSCIENGASGYEVEEKKEKENYNAFEKMALNKGEIV